MGTTFLSFLPLAQVLQFASVADGRGISGRQQCYLFFQIHGNFGLPISWQGRLLTN